MKIIFLAFFVAILVTLIHCDEVKVKKLEVDNKALIRSRFIRVGRRYYVSTDQATFLGAVISCKTGGMELATPTNENAQSELYNATLDSPYKNSDGYWIGAASSNSYSYNTFYWINTAIKVMISNWGSGQPRYVNGLGYGGCVKLGNTYKVNESSKWASADCNRLLNYVCEFST